MLFYLHTCVHITRAAVGSMFVLIDSMHMLKCALMLQSLHAIVCWQQSQPYSSFSLSCSFSFTLQSRLSMSSSGMRICFTTRFLGSGWNHTGSLASLQPCNGLVVCCCKDSNICRMWYAAHAGALRPEKRTSSFSTIMAALTSVVSGGHDAVSETMTNSLPHHAKEEEVKVERLDICHLGHHRSEHFLFDEEGTLTQSTL